MSAFTLLLRIIGCTLSQPYCNSGPIFRLLWKSLYHKRWPKAEILQAAEALQEAGSWQRRYIQRLARKEGGLGQK